MKLRDMPLRPWMLAMLGGCLLLATGCRSVLGIGNCHKAQPYAEAQDLPPLQMPTGLDGPDTANALKIPALTQPEAPPDPDGPCLEHPPALTAPPLPASEVVMPEAPAPRGRRSRREDGSGDPPAEPQDLAPR